jgi:hypothetical protein
MRLEDLVVHLEPQLKGAFLAAKKLMAFWAWTDVGRVRHLDGAARAPSKGGDPWNPRGGCEIAADNNDNGRSPHRRRTPAGHGGVVVSVNHRLWKQIVSRSGG